MNRPGDDVFVAKATSTTAITNDETRRIRLRVLMAVVSTTTRRDLTIRQTLERRIAWPDERR